MPEGSLTFATIGDIMPDVMKLFGDFTVTNMLEIVGAIMAVTVPLTLAWFGYNYGKRKASGALKKGRL